MREIKFRFWKPNTKEMLSLSDALGFLVNVSDLISGKYDNFKPLQYTGLEDKNGREIYEKDFIMMGNSLYVVGWSRRYGGYRLFDKVASTGLNSYHFMDYEVIGNVFENPELLEV